MIRFIDLFAGIGGFHLGFEKANDSTTQQKGEDNKIQSKRNSRNTETAKRKYSKFSCVWANENNKYAAEIYKKRFPKTELSTEDIRTVDAERIPNHDLLCAGFPCQSFSIAGKRKGFDDTRGTLFFEIARIIKAKRPSLVLLENVKGLLSHEAGKTFGRIIEVLGELGYWVEWQVLNSKDFGVPQNRERVFIIGHLGKEGREQVFPIGESGKALAGKDKNIANAITSNYWKGAETYGGRTMIIEGGSENEEVLCENGKGSAAFRDGQEGEPNSGTMQREMGSGENSEDNEQGEIALPCATKKGYAIAKEGDGVRLQHMNSKTARGRVINSKAQSLQTSGLGGTIQNNKIRRLTPIECERLQGFPDGFTEGLSDTQRYKCLGNAVTVNVIQVIGERILQHNNNYAEHGKGKI